MTDSDLLDTIEWAIEDSEESPEYPRWCIHYYSVDEDDDDDEYGSFLETGDYWIMDGKKDTAKAVYEKCYEIVKNRDESYLEYTRIVLVKENDEYKVEDLIDIWNKKRDQHKLNE
jgi:hypothetical protein